MALSLVPADLPVTTVAIRPTRRRGFRDRTTLPILLLLTVLAGVLRFASLDRPSVWGDEAATYGRIAGTYQELLDQLTSSAFPPLHYELEWWVGQGLPYWGTFDQPANPDAPRTFKPTRFIVPGGIRLTPFALRFIPSLAGTLFIPAIFFLAVQLFGRRIALTAAALACFSAYFLVYSRDAKMYMHFWLFVTLHVACALWWVRTRRLLPWACWLLCGMVMVGLHSSGYVVLLIDALIVFTSPRQHWRHFYTMVPLLFWNVGLVPARAVEWYRYWFGQPRTDWHIIAVWRHRAWRGFGLPVVLPLAIGMFLMAAAAEGPLGFYSAFSQRIQNVAERDRAQVNPNELGIGWVSIYNDGRTLPTYLLYTTSAYLTGWEWPRHTVEPISNDQSHVQPQTLWLLQTATVSLLALLAIGIVPWRRLFQPVRARLDRVCQDGRVWRPLRSRRVLWIGIWVAAIPWVTYTQSTSIPLNILDGAAKVMLVSPPTINWPRLPVVIDDQMTLWQKTRTSIEVFQKQWPAAWQAYAAAWSHENLSRPTAYIAAATLFGWIVLLLLKRRAIGRGTLRLIGVVALLIVGGALIAVLPRKVDDDVWMPRYLGTILPAFFILLAVLIDRQPVLIRWLTIGLFVVVNMGQFSARVWGYSEPPTALMAADLIASQPKSRVPTQPERPTFRAYMDLRHYRMFEPGGGTLFTTPGRYYMRMLSGVPGDLFGVRGEGRGNDYEDDTLEVRDYSNVDLIERDLRANPQIERFVVWTGLPTGATDLEEPIGDRLFGQFRRVSDEVWQVRDHWRWVERFQVRRRTYVRVSPPVK